MIGSIIGAISGFMYSKLLIIMLLAVGLYFTVRTRFLQVRHFTEMIKVVGEKPENEDSVSSFQALMVSTASRVGTGNIVGVATAICMGGFGAVFWMWVIAFIGGASAFVESTVAQIYKRKRRRTVLLYRGSAQQLWSGICFRNQHASDLCRRIQHALRI